MKRPSWTPNHRFSNARSVGNPSGCFAAGFAGAAALYGSSAVLCRGRGAPPTTFQLDLASTNLIIDSLNVAEAAEADYLVTGNTRPFLKLMAGQRIVNARQFLDCSLDKKGSPVTVR